MWTDWSRPPQEVTFPNLRHSAAVEATHVSDKQATTPSSCKNICRSVLFFAAHKHIFYLCTVYLVYRSHFFLLHTIGNRPRARRMPLVFNHRPKIMQIPSSSGRLSESTNQFRRLLEPMSHWRRAIVSQCRWWWMLIKKWDGNERCSSTFTASPPRLCFWN